MSYDYNEDNDYGDHEIVCDYDDHYAQPEEDGINLEDMLILAKSENDISKFKEIIELEKDNFGSQVQYSFMSYQQLCIIFIRSKDISKFSDNFSLLVNLYPKVEYSYKIDTMREIIYALSYCNDQDFSSEICRSIINILFDKIGTDKSIDRELLNTGVLFCKNLIQLGKVEELGELLEEMFDCMDRMDMREDESLSNSKLELLVLKIQFCNLKNNSKEAKQLYYEAYNMNRNKVITDNTISSIINEQGGKLYMIQRNYEKALELFKQAFYNFQSSGNNNKAKEMIKYSVLNSIIVRNSKSFVSEEEVKHYLWDKQLCAMLELKRAYESADITQINKIWNEQILKTETDQFIITQVNEILHSIRFNYIQMKLSAYQVCKFDTLCNEIGVDRDYLVSLLLEMISSDNMLNIRINFTDNCVVIKERNMNQDYSYSNINKWLVSLNNQ